MSDPIVVATIPDPPDPVVVPGTMPTDGFDTSLSASQANILATSKAQRDDLNAKLTKGYAATYAKYALNMHSGNPIPDDQRQPPKPPMAWELAPPDKDGYVWIQQGTTPVCPAGPAITPNSDYAAPVPLPNHVSINWASREGAWVTANKDDGIPSGKTFPAGVISDPNHPEEAPAAWERWGTAAGPGWYERIG